MNKYLEAIGFKNIRTRKQAERVSTDTILHFDEKKLYLNEQGAMIGVFSKEFGEDMGLVVTGEFDEKGNYHPSSTNPYLHSEVISSESFIEIEKRRAGEEYAACCDDYHFGSAIVFHMINAGEYMVNQFRVKKNDSSSTYTPPLYPANVRLTALSVDGSVILPVLKSAYEAEEISRRTEEHADMAARARLGDEDALDGLAEFEYNNMEMIQNRVYEEDLLTIVDTSLVPSGMEADEYRVLGTITDCKLTKNNETQELVWQMYIKACGIPLRVAIHYDRLRGHPLPGRRFRGTIWLSGEVGFMEEPLQNGETDK